DRWIMPHTTLTMERGAGEKPEKIGLYDDFPGVPERDVVMSRVKDPLYPWLGLGMMPFGAGFTALTVGLATGRLCPSHRGGVSRPHSGGLSGAGKDIAAMGAIGLLAAILDGFSLYYIAKGPDLVPTYRVEAPRAKRLSASPTGIGVRF